MNILHILHRKPELYSGTEKLVLQLARMATGDGHKVSILYPKTVAEEIEPVIDATEENGVGLLEITRTEREGDFAPPGPDARALNDLFYAALDRIAPDVVHIHQLTDMPVGALPGAVGSGARTVLTLHDFSLFCKQFFLVRKNGNYCDTADSGKNCARYCGEKQAVERRQMWRQMRGGGPEAAFYGNVVRARQMAVKRVHVVTALSEFVLQIFRREGFELENARVIELGIAKFEVEHKGVVDLPVRFAALGTISRSKGADLLIDVFKDIAPEQAVLTFHGGRIDADVKEMLDAAVAAYSNIRNAGAYEEKELPGILAGADCLINATRLPETYSLVLSEAWQAGVPVIAADIGAIPGRVDRGVNGLLFEPGDMGGLARAVQTVIGDPQMIDRMASNAPEVKALGQYYDELMELYVSEKY